MADLAPRDDQRDFVPALAARYLLVDAHHQGRGVGRRVVEGLVERLRAAPACELIRMSHHPDNDASRSLFTSLGFVSTGEEEDGELFMALAAR